MSRRLPYLCSRWRTLPALPFHVLEALLLRSSVQACHHGVRICDLTARDSTAFAQATIACLDLIREEAPVFFGRIQRHVSFIANSATWSGADYRSFSRVIKIDFSKWWCSATPSESLRRYALILVHEAAHGYLCARHFPYTKATRSRVERVCVNESNRFVRHMGGDWGELHRAFNEDEWQFSWCGSRLDKLNLQLQKSSEALRNG